MYYINDHIVKELYNEFGGSERKKTILLDDGNKYLLKMSDPVREKGLNLSYINNAISEYFGCKIAKMIGLPVQDVILGDYTYVSGSGNRITRPACLCKSLEYDDVRLREIKTVDLSNYENLEEQITFENTDKIIEGIKEIDTARFKKFYYNMFVFDALVGNTDRHNGNWAILTNNKDVYDICPIYDCGSSLLPMVDDADFPSINKNSLYLSICSVISKDGKRINYKSFLENEGNKDVDSAIKRLISHINIEEIKTMIKKTDGISEVRKDFYTDFIEMRYQRIIIPALQRIFGLHGLKEAEASDKEVYDFYKQNIEKIAEKPLFEKQVVRLKTKEYTVMKISNRYAVLIKKEGCIGLLPIRSGNKEVKLAMTVIKNLDNKQRGVGYGD